MFSKVRDVFRVREVFFSRIYWYSVLSVYRSIELKQERPTFVMKLFEMVNFVLILVIAMVSWPSLPFQVIVSMAFISFVLVASAAEYLAKRTKHHFRLAPWTPPERYHRRRP